MLLQHVTRKTVRPRRSPKILLLKPVDFAVRLLHGLLNLQCIKPVPPRSHFILVSPDGMPQPHCSTRAFDVQPFEIDVDEAPLMPDTGYRSPGPARVFLTWL